MSTLVTKNGSRSAESKAAPPAAPDLPEAMSVVVVGDASGLERYVPALESLAAAAIEPNVYYEPWMFLPALRAFGGGADLLFVLVFAPDPQQPQGPGILCGFFPLERHSRYKGLPVASYSLWKHSHCFLCTPLLRAGYARDCLARFLEWLSADRRGAPLMEFRSVSGEGPFQQLLIDYFRRNDSLIYLDDSSTRAFFRPRAESNAYLQAAISGDFRRNIKRKERRLADNGPLEYVELGPDGDVEVWLEDFLRLEGSGWKGREGSALACSESGRTFFLTIAREAFRRGSLFMHALHLNGRPIAQRCNFLSGSGSFFFKPGYDENYARFSPGLLLEIETIHRLHARPDIRWMDSCTSADNAMLNDIWIDRRTIQSIVVAARKGSGGFVVSIVPLLKWLRRQLPFAGTKAAAADGVNTGTKSAAADGVNN